MAGDGVGVLSNDEMRGVLSHDAMGQERPCGRTDTTENITFPQTMYAGTKMIKITTKTKKKTRLMYNVESRSRISGRWCLLNLSQLRQFSLACIPH